MDLLLSFVQGTFFDANSVPCRGAWHEPRTVGRFCLK